MRLENKDNLLSLIRLGIGHHSNSFSAKVNWDEIEATSGRHGLSAIIVDGIERLPEAQRPPKEKLLQMIGQVVQWYEYRYELYSRAIAELAAFYNSREIKMMVLKGYTCSLVWPKPEHRPCGDIDIWQFGKQKDADFLLASEKGVKVDDSHHHHTVFIWRDFSVENHYDFINIYHHRQNKDLELLFKELGRDDSHYVELYGERVYLPSPNLHALFLLRHMMTDFVSTVVTLRQLLDWAFWIQKYHDEIDWKWLMEVLDKYGMTKLFMVINAICIEDLGFEPSIFPSIQYLPTLKERVLSEIISPEFSPQMPSHVVKRVIYKYRRWRASGWKHELCYNESMWSAFWSGIWGHLLKPKSI